MQKLDQVLVFETTEKAAASAAKHAADLIRAAVAAQGNARVIAATGNSQMAFIDNLIAEKDVPWNRVTLFHMDEYAGISATHPASFRLWIRTRIEDRVRLAAAHYINGDAFDVDAEAERYTKLLLGAPIDLA